MKILFFVFAFVFPSKKVEDEKKWIFLKEKEGIKVYFHQSSKNTINEVKIVTTFKTNLSTITEVFKDVESYPKWVYKAQNSNIVKKINPLEIEYYNHLDFPWPIDDREIVIHNTISQNQKTKILISVSYASNTLIQKKDKFVRITNFNSKWTFIPLNNGLVNGEYIFKSDPGGNIPVWLINLSLDEGPIKTITNFKKQLALPQYTKINSLNILN